MTDIATRSGGDGIPLYLVRYLIETPHTNSRKWGEYDYVISFVTDFIEHPEVIDQDIILLDAVERIPHLDAFIDSLGVTPEILAGQDPSPTLYLTFALRLPSSLDANQRLVDYLLSHYTMYEVYGDESNIEDIPRKVYPEPLMTR